MTESVATCYTHLVIYKQVMAALASTEGGQAATPLEWFRLPFMYSVGTPWYELRKVTLNPCRASVRAQVFRFTVEFDITAEYVQVPVHLRVDCNPNRPLLPTLEPSVSLWEAPAEGPQAPKLGPRASSSSSPAGGPDGRGALRPARAPRGRDRSRPGGDSEVRANAPGIAVHMNSGGMGTGSENNSLSSRSPQRSF